MKSDIIKYALSIRLHTAHVLVSDYYKSIIIRACTGFDGDVKV